MQHINVVTVLGSGVMGSGIAAHLANCAEEAGIHRIYLLDQKSEQKNCNTLGQRGLNRISGDNRIHLALPEYANRITVGNFSDDLERAVSEADWVIEAIVEDEELKRNLYAKAFPFLNRSAILSSNTSGIPIHCLMLGQPDSLQRRFLITHFFNPPRHMKLLELVSGNLTDASVMSRMQGFGRHALGKGVVIGRDTPGFVSNRIGVHQLHNLLHLAEKHGPELLDYIFGKHLWGAGGKPFVTCEKIGLDTLRDVGTDIALRASDGIVRVPDYIDRMIELGLLGEKGRDGRGFYASRGKEVFDIESGSYRPAKGYGKGGPTLDSVERARRASGPAEAVRIMFEAKDVGGDVWRRVELSNIAYALTLTGEICDSILDIDKAIRWGWNRVLGPGEIADAADFSRVVDVATRVGHSVPEWAQELAGQGGALYRPGDGQERLYFDLARRDHIPEPTADEIVSFRPLSRAEGTLVERPGGVRIIRLHKNPTVLGVEIISRNGTISMEVIEGVHQALDLTLNQEDCAGAVIANPKDVDFSFGADLFVLAGLSYRASRGEAWAEKAFLHMSSRFQQLNERLIRHPLPVVVAKHRTAVGGGAELGFGGHIRATMELYTGLVEFAVGILPGGGGLKNLLFNRYDMRTAEGRLEADPLTYIMDVVEAVAWNWLLVSTSGDHARKLGYLRIEDRISRNPDFLVRDAVADVLRLRCDYRPALFQRRVKLPGREAHAQIMNYSDWAVAANRVAHEFVPRIMEELAAALTTGPEGQEVAVTEDEMLKREQKAAFNLAMAEPARRLAARALRMDFDQKFLDRALAATESYQQYVGGEDK